ncbi:hypothetical protein ACU4GD_13745 [Cupriavidus basilensis]
MDSSTAPGGRARSSPACRHRPPAATFDAPQRGRAARGADARDPVIASTGWPRPRSALPSRRWPVVAGEPAAARARQPPRAPRRRAAGLHLLRPSRGGTCGCAVRAHVPRQLDRGGRHGADLDLTESGTQGMAQLGVDLDVARRRKRRQFACTLSRLERTQAAPGRRSARRCSIASMVRKWIEPTSTSRAARDAARATRDPAHRFG